MPPQVVVIALRTSATIVRRLRVVNGRHLETAPRRAQRKASRGEYGTDLIVLGGMTVRQASLVSG